MEQFIYKVSEKKCRFSYLLPESLHFDGKLPNAKMADFCSYFLLGFHSPHPYASSNFRHFYARKGGTLKWRHRVVAYGCGYLEITVSVYALRSPRLSFLFADHPFLLQSVCIWRIASFFASYRAPLVSNTIAFTSRNVVFYLKKEIYDIRHNMISL